jgi:spore maturation protein CgeB
VRIFQVIGGSSNAHVPGSRTWYLNLHQSLLEMGHEVVLFRTGGTHRHGVLHHRFDKHVFGEKMYSAFLEEHRRQPFQLFFSYLTDNLVDVEALDLIRSIGVPTCNFSCNNVHQFDLVDEVSPHFDYNLHAERDVADKFRAIGANPLWWPMASNPTYFKPVDVPRTIDVSFVGAHYALRGEYIAHLLMHGIDVHSFGPVWTTGDLSARRALLKHYWFLARAILAARPSTQYWSSAKLAELDFRRHLAAQYPDHLHAPISDDELIALYSRSRISLGFLDVFDQHDPTRGVARHVHLREFEAPMCRALYLTGYSEELAEMFEPGKEMLMYRDQHDMLDKVSYFLDHPKHSERIRDAGHRRALSDHTYRQRYEELFRAIGIG